jgi:hypothetical protein
VTDKARKKERKRKRETAAKFLEPKGKMKKINIIFFLLCCCCVQTPVWMMRTAILGKKTVGP